MPFAPGDRAIPYFARNFLRRSLESAPAARVDGGNHTNVDQHRGLLEFARIISYWSRHAAPLVGGGLRRLLHLERIIAISSLDKDAHTRWRKRCDLRSFVFVGS